MGQGVGEPGVGIDGVELGGFDQGVGDGGGFAACLGAHEEVVPASEGDAAHAEFGGVVIDLKDAVVEVGAQAFHPGQGVSDCCGQRGFSRDRGELHGQPSLQIVEDRGGMGLSQFDTSIRWGASGLFLDGIEPGDPADGLFRDGGALRTVDVDELAPDMGHAGDLADGPRAVEVLEPGIAIGMHPSAEAGEMVLRVLALAVAGEPIPGGGRGGAVPWPFVSRIGPEPRGPGLAGAGRQHADRRVIGEDRLGRQDMATDGIGQWLQKGGGLADPVGQSGTIEIKPFAVEDPALAVERQVIGIFADQHVGQETWPRAAPLDGAGGQRRLDEPFAAGAGQPGTDDPVHDEAARHVFQLPGDILTDPAQAATAIGTCLGARGQLDLHPGDMVRDRTTLGFVLLLDVRQSHPGGHRGGGDLAGLQRQLKLLGRLGRGAKPVRPVPGQLMSELLDQDRLRLDLDQKPCGEAAQLLGVFRQDQALIKHGKSLSHGIPCGNPSIAGRVVYPAARGRRVRSGARQSIPSKSIANCAGVSATFPPLAEGQTNRPFSSRFRNMQAPWPSRQITFTRSPRRPRNTNRCPANGSCFKTASASAASAANPLHMSVTPAASQTRVFAGTGVKRSTHGSAAPAPRDHSSR
jgi:hypothetical protein